MRGSPYTAINIWIIRGAQRLLLVTAVATREGSSGPFLVVVSPKFAWQDFYKREMNDAPARRSYQ